MNNSLVKRLSILLAINLRPENPALTHAAVELSPRERWNRSSLNLNRNLNHNPNLPRATESESKSKSMIRIKNCVPGVDSTELPLPPLWGRHL